MIRSGRTTPGFFQSRIAGAALGLSMVIAGGAAQAQVVLPPGILPGACSPLALTRLVIRDISPGVAAADPRAQPRTLTRDGATRFRSEEQPDMTRAGETRLVIISEPDIWSIDLARGRGVHSVDPGPELVVRAPVLPISADMPPRFMSLEFGCEGAFVAAYAPDAAQAGTWGVYPVGLHTLVEGEHGLSMLMDTRTLKPLIITYSKAGKVVFALRYDDYRSDLPGNPALFARPEGVQIVEAPAVPATR